MDDFQIGDAVRVNVELFPTLDEIYVVMEKREDGTCGLSNGIDVHQRHLTRVT